MGAPTKYCVAALTLTFTGAVSAGTGSDTALVTDSSGQPVRGTSFECWQSSLPSTGGAHSCASAVTSGASIAATTTTTAPTAATAPAMAQPAATSPQEGNPVGYAGYVTDSTGQVVRGSLGECWHSSAWSPAVANVVGCDGVLSRAVPVPAPAPSPKPQPPAEPARPPETERAAPSSTAQSTVPAPAGSTAQAVVPPRPPSDSGPQAIAPPVAPIPPAQPTPEPSSIAPAGEATRSGAVPRRQSEPGTSKITLDTDAYFDFDKATLKPQGKRRLEALAARLIDMDLEVVVATGHTDATGSDAYNQRLSERRALTVKRYLAQKGIARDRIFTEGKGEKQPVASNLTRAGRAQNRRVDVEMVGIPKR